MKSGKYFWLLGQRPLLSSINVTSLYAAWLLEIRYLFLKENKIPGYGKR